LQYYNYYIINVIKVELKVFIKTMNKLIKNKGFTLIEILVVIGIIAVLAAIVVVAINPSRQFAQARNTQRESNVNTILNAIGQNMVDNKGVALSVDTCAGIDTVPSATPKHIGTDSGLVDLSCLVPTYISSSIPFDPTNGDEGDTQYTIELLGTGRYKVCAPGHQETAIADSTAYCLTR
jgi:prepilin-type N-terminal cleavage/methylation domain-containing protein